jgi:glycine oxidase
VSPATTDVVVVGGGAIGMSVARALALSGANVTLVERPAIPGEGWRASAGMIAAQIETQPDDPLFDLAIAGRRFFRANATLLRETTGVDIGLVECGVLQVVLRTADVDDVKERVAWQRQQAHRADWLSDREVAEGWPWLAPCFGAHWSPEDGAVDPRRVVAAFRADAVRLGARISTDAITGLEIVNDRLVGVIGDEHRYPASTVVIAAGAWSGRLAHLPRPLSVEPVRGQMMAFAWPANVPPAIVYGDHCYLLERQGEMLVGATVEHAGFDASTTTGGLTRLKQLASAVYPQLAGMPAVRQWAGLRPGTPDGLPIIGHEPRLPGLWYATGHGRNGILLAGITGELVARGIRGEALGDELHAFRPERFWER